MKLPYNSIHIPRPVLHSEVPVNLISGQVHNLLGKKSDLTENFIMILSDANEILLMSLGKLNARNSGTLSIILWRGRSSDILLLTWIFW